MSYTEANKFKSIHVDIPSKFVSLVFYLPNDDDNLDDETQLKNGMIEVKGYAVLIKSRGISFLRRNISNDGNYIEAISPTSIKLIGYIRDDNRFESGYTQVKSVK